MKVRDFSKWISENDEICQGGPTSGEGRIKDVERKTGLVIPGHLRELYRLHEGVEMPHGYIPPLQGESSLPEMLEIIKDADLGWDLATWLPFFDYQTGDYDAVEIKNAKGRVARLDPKTGEMVEVSPSFEEWLDGAVEEAVRYNEELKTAKEE